VEVTGDSWRDIVGTQVDLGFRADAQGQRQDHGGKPVRPHERMESNSQIAKK